VELNGEPERLYVFPINHVDIELHHLLLLLITWANTGEFPGGDEQIALLRGN
jgi:hypothetical protein